MEIDDDKTGIFHVFELRIGMNEFDHRNFYRCLSREKDLNRDSNPDLCIAGAVLYQLSHQANWEQVVMWPFSLLLKQQYKTVMIKFILLSAVQIYMENSCIMVVGK